MTVRKAIAVLICHRVPHREVMWLICGAKGLAAWEMATEMGLACNLKTFENESLCSFVGY